MKSGPSPGYLLIAVVSMFLSPALQAQSTLDDEATQQETLSTARMKAMTKRVAALQATDKSGKAIPLIRPPLFRYTDPIRKTNDGVISAWGTKSGRPTAMIGLFTEPANANQISWSYEFIALASPGFKISSSKPYSGFVWAPKSSELEWKMWQRPGKQLKKSKVAVRNQLKALSSKFLVKERMRGLHRLRRLPKAILEYDDKKAGILLGTSFLFVYGTNPEAIVMLECRENDKADAGISWHYAFARATAAEVWAELDGVVVWKPDIAWQSDSSRHTDSSYYIAGMRSAPIGTTD